MTMNVVDSLDDSASQLIPTKIPAVTTNVTGPILLLQHCGDTLGSVESLNP